MQFRWSKSSQRNDYRRWLYLYTNGHKTSRCISFQLGKLRWFGFSFDMDQGEGQLVAAVHAWWSLYVTYEGPHVSKLLRKMKGYDGRDTHLYWIPKEHYVSGALWDDSEGSWEKGKKYRRFHWTYLDTIFGKAKHNLEIVREEDIKIVMPEGTYDGHAKFERRTWRRPRSLRTLTREYWDIDVPKGLPVPGKGENSWDCDDDAIYGSSF